MEYKKQIKKEDPRDEMLLYLWTKANELEKTDLEASRELRREALKRYNDIKTKYIFQDESEK